MGQCPRPGVALSALSHQFPEQISKKSEDANFELGLAMHYEDLSWQKDRTYYIYCSLAQFVTFTYLDKEYVGLLLYSCPGLQKCQGRIYLTKDKP